MINEDEYKLIIYALSAIRGAVTSAVRSISVEQNEKNLKLKCVFDANASEDEIELLSIASSEFIANYTSDYKLEEIMIKIPYPENTKPLKHVLYQQHENNL